MIIILRTSLWFCLIILFLPVLVFANNNTFLVSVLGGEDTESPSIPTMESAIPIASNQIDLTWSTATDNNFLFGYVLLRDSVPIATTTLTNYTDTGLNASTTYYYSVYAFDGFFNISSTSPVLATTTLQLPIVDVEVQASSSIKASSTASQSTQLLTKKSFSLATTLNEAELEWQTSRPIRYELRWGKNNIYEGGYIISDVYRSAQKTTITELEPDTKYLFELKGYDARGFSMDIKSGTFITKSITETLIPNVLDFKAVLLSDNKVDLKYVLPVGFETNKVRILRSYLGYPRDPFDGQVIFEGQNESFIDSNAFFQSETEYYSIFIIGSDGTYSSGAVTKIAKESVNIFSEIEEDNVQQLFEEGEDMNNVLQEEIQEEDTKLSIEMKDIEMKEINYPTFNFDVSSIQIIQEKNQFTFASSSIILKSDIDILVRIPLESINDHFKSIVVNFNDTTQDKLSYSFLLRINKDKTAYEALISTKNISNINLIVVEIFDYEWKILGSYEKAIQFVQNIETESVVSPTQKIEILNINPKALYGLVPVIPLGLWYFRRRRTEDKN